MDGIETLQEWVKRANCLQQEFIRILSKYESSSSRVIVLDQSYEKLTSLSIKQDELFRQALRCVENGLFRAAHVMAWAAFIDYFEEKLGSDGFLKLKNERPNWLFSSVDDLREKYPEHQLIEAGRLIGLLTKQEEKILIGLLNKRNECAHPSNYFPGLNETLGYISELFSRIETLMNRIL